MFINSWSDVWWNIRCGRLEALAESLTRLIQQPTENPHSAGLRRLRFYAD
jgi:hypothetical protein